MCTISNLCVQLSMESITVAPMCLLASCCTIMKLHSINQLHQSMLRSIGFCCAGSTLETTLQRLGSQFQEVSIQESAFVKPASVLYELDGEGTHASYK